ncbi:MAG: hypothetical protein ACR2JG_08775, partial [Geodermatophilaceae bacterium]
ALAVLGERGVPAWVAGRITERPGAAESSAASLTGNYADSRDHADFRSHADFTQRYPPAE